MKTLLRLLIALIVLAGLAGVVFLATWDIPVPSRPVEKTVPDDRFAR